MEITIQASEFKAKCLKLLDDVRKGDTFLITKRGIPFAKLSAPSVESKRLFGAMQNSFTENDDIQKPINCVWTVEDE
ncbi:MAG: type II toxin-antitoxin system prevent-host-death family antitoxin [Holosporales bacterium]|jgi:antitoxin (DNA-binding transcriptional repressor) of toxin-antitoxin stability system|nr:type II toxin-antitoxin system prevent-host-death family antitoxin [Holosporales bacterium]